MPESLPFPAKLILSQNVLLTRDKPPNVKVADFGLAKVVDSLTMLKVCDAPSFSPCQDAV